MITGLFYWALLLALCAAYVLPAPLMRVLDAFGGS